MDEREIARRVPVWTALAELFLDTELQDFDYRHIADILRASGYTGHELEKMLKDEVAPVFDGNLHIAAGEWQPWDAEFVKNRMLDHLKSRPAFTKRFRPSATLSGRRAADMKKHWDVLAEMLRER